MDTPGYSIVVPAWNEAELLPRTLTQLQKSMAGCAVAGELIVVDNHSTDDTAAIAREAGAAVVYEPENNIARARNAGAAAARSEILIFVDADTCVSKQLLALTVERMRSGRFYAGGAALSFDAPLAWLPRGMTALWNRIAPRRKWASGCYLYCTKGAFERAGGFAVQRYAGEELHLCRALHRVSPGLEFSWIDAFPVVSSARKMQRHSSFQLFGRMFLLGIFPFLRRSPKACSIWYRR